MIPPDSKAPKESSQFSRKLTVYAKTLSALKMTTLIVILLAALRILACPKPLSVDEMKFLWWALGTAAAVLFASNASGQKR